MEQRDFFISYTKEDQDWAEWTAEVLKRRGYTTYVQYKDSPPGEDFVEWYTEAVPVSRNFIVIWSKTASESDYCKEECKIAYQRKIKHQMGLLLPVHIEDVPRYSVLERFTHINLFTVQPEKIGETLLKAVRNAALPPLPEPPMLPIAQKAKKLFKMGLESYNNEDYLSAREYWEQAAELGDAKAFNSLGILYKSGLGVVKDTRQAIHYYQEAAKRGHKLAQENLDELRRQGYSV